MSIAESSEMMKLSDFARVMVSDEGEFEIETRSEAGRGKRFGTTGSVSLTPDEMESLLKWYVQNKYPFAFESD